MSCPVLHFRQILFVAFLILLHNSMCAQRINPKPYPSQINVNYVRTWVSKAPQADINNIKLTSSVDSFSITTEYSDGLGRLIQTVGKQSTPLNKDIVMPVEYDEFGREQFQYLPFAANNTGGNNSIADGLFKYNPFQQDSVFSKAQYPGEKYFYSQTFYEASHLDKALESFAPGDNWVGTSLQVSAGNRRSVKTAIHVNTVYDSVRIWIASSMVSSVPVTTTKYAAGELIKTIVKDEHSKQVVEYKDKEGRLILKKNQLALSPGTAHVGWLCTYYIYDEHSNLRFVLSPKAIQLLQSSGNWNISASVRDELCFYYGYDSRNRLTIKKVPGAGEVFMVYDSRDRLVMSQDALLRKTSTWHVTLYDEMNRAVQSGLVNNSLLGNKSFVTHLNDAAQSVPYPFNEQSIPSSSYEELTKTFYDNYDWLTLNTGHTFSANRSITDDRFLLSDTGFPFPQSLLQSKSLRGMETGTKIKVLGSNPAQFLYSITYYDQEGRPIQVQSQNIMKGVDIATTQYSYTGQLLLSIVSHQKAAGEGRQKILSKNIIDNAGRLIKQEKMVIPEYIPANTAFPSFRTVLQVEYNELGKPKKKKIGINFSSEPNPLDSIVYDYNIRGWLLGANRNYVKSTTSTSNYFGYDLAYDKTPITTSTGSSLGRYTAAQFNGNIAGVAWKSTGDDQIRKYDFTYDAMNRLLTADFNQYTGSTFNKTAGLDFSTTNLSYDGNGNILNQYQKGWKITGSVLIDQLAYTYFPNSNRLKNVVDSTNDVNTELSDFRSSSVFMSALGGTKTAAADDYTYDENGNLLTDRNKDIENFDGAAGIEYNHLNLPRKIIIKSGPNSNKGSIEYIYDATGNKLKKIISETGKQDKVTLFMIGVYQDNVLEYFPQQDGRIRKITRTVATGGSPCDPVPGGPPCEEIPDSVITEMYVFDYFIKDHLGNVRMVLTEEDKTDAYPAASMEAETASTEEALYANLNTTRADIPAGYPANSISNSGIKLSKVNGSGNKIGPSIALKVMAGDKFNVRVTSWYKLNGNPITAPNPITDLANALINSFGSMTGSKANALELASTGVLSPGATVFLNGQAYSSARPKAYLNWILFDEQFKYVSSSSGYQQVGNDGEFKTHLYTGLNINKNGFLYIYVSNETPNIDVFFDNLQVTHIRGPILEETHYYPFGLTMSGINSRAVEFGKDNRYKFNDGTELANKEMSDGSGLELYETPFRSYDPQIGRFHQIDAMADSYENWSPYCYSLNNPVNLNDPTGLTTNEPGEEDKPIDKGGLLETVTLKTSLKNKKNYHGWLSYARKQRNESRIKVYQKLKDEGVDERGLRLYWMASGDLPYWDKLDKIEKEWRGFVQDVLTEVVLTVATGPVLRLGGKLVSVGYRKYKIYSGLKTATAANEKIKYIGRMSDLKNVPRSKTFIDDLPDLGSPKANYYQNMSVLRKAIRDGYTIKDASWFRPNSELTPTLLRPNRTVGQTFLGAERLLLKNKGLLK